VFDEIEARTMVGIGKTFAGNGLQDSSEDGKG